MCTIFTLSATGIKQVKQNTQVYSVRTALGRTPTHT